LWILTTYVTFYSRAKTVNGEYSVSLNGKVGTIKIESVTENNAHTARLAISRIKIEIPYSIPEDENDTRNGRGYTPPPTSPVKREALNYYNRFIDVLRWKTRKFWIRPISESDVSYMEISKVNDIGKKRQGFSFDMGNPSFPPYPLNSVDESSAKYDIDTLLMNEMPIAFHDILFLDAINYYWAGRFDEATITMNIALESFVANFLADKLRKSGRSEMEVKKKIDKAFSTDRESHKAGMRKAITKYFKEIENRSLEQDVELWQEFEKARNKRASLIHPKDTAAIKRAQKRTLLDARGCLEILRTLVKVWEWSIPSPIHLQLLN
jgi:hypothetical protein